MKSYDKTGPSEAETSPESRPSRLMRKRWQVIGVAIALVVGVGGLAWSWRHPDVSFESSYGIGSDRRVGETVWTTLADSSEPGSSPVLFTDLEPIFENDGAAVTVEYLICELDPVALEEEGVGGFGYGGRTRDLKRYCASTRPAIGADFTRPSSSRRELLVGITPTRPGDTVISGHHVAYRVGWQRGSSDIHVEVDVRVRRAS